MSQATYYRILNQGVHRALKHVRCAMGIARRFPNFHDEGKIMAENSTGGR
jgi:hypothetical protein